MYNYSRLLFLLISFTAFSQEPQKKVTALSGDGIFSLLRENGIDPTKYYKEFIVLNKNKISINNGLFIGETYILPAIKGVSKKEIISTKSKVVKATDSIPEKLKDSIPLIKTEFYPIFGNGNTHITIENNILKGAIYYLISGHGGPDPGATTTYNGKLITEDEYAYDVTLRLARLLILNGAQVYIIIKDPNDGIRDQQVLEVDYDEVNYSNSPISKSQKLRLWQRTQAVNNLYLKHKEAYQRLIVTHVDSRSKSKNIDVFFYHHKKSKNGRQLAEQIHKSFKQKYAEHQPNRKYLGTVGSRSSLYLIKNSLPAMVYIELGNITNTKDQKRILNYENREALAKWIHNGLLDDYIEQKK